MQVEFNRPPAVIPPDFKGKLWSCPAWKSGKSSVEQYILVDAIIEAARKKQFQDLSNCSSEVAIITSTPNQLKWLNENAPWVALQFGGTRLSEGPPDFYAEKDANLNTVAVSTPSRKKQKEAYTFPILFIFSLVLILMQMSLAQTQTPI